MDILRNPWVSAMIAVLVTYMYLNIKNKINNEHMTTSDYVKPAILNGIMVYFIIHYGGNQRIVQPAPY
jgi:hypothetical protein